jgi:nickel-type superoxide dismutase maturation protease
MRARWGLLGAVTAVLVGALIRARPFRAEVAGDSMAPTLMAGDWLIATRPDRLRRGQVVVVRHPERDLELVKRVAALPGDRVDGRTLGAEEYLVVGDNRGASSDGRSFGPVRRQAILGVVRVRYWPRPGPVGWGAGG